MSTINIQIIVDGAELAQQISEGSIHPGSQNNPTALSSIQSDNYISMVTESRYVSNNTQGNSELQVNANVGDIIGHFTWDPFINVTN